MHGNAATLLISGMVSTALFLAVVLIEGLLRSGYDPIYHTGSELELGGRGWIMRGAFLCMAAGMMACAVGIYQSLNTVAGAGLIAIFGFGLVIPGVFVPDPIRGYPPGAPSTPGAALSWRHHVHHASAPVMFVALFSACIVISTRLAGIWTLYTEGTAVVGFVLMVWTARAYAKDAGNTGLVQRALILVSWTWLILLGIHLL